MSVYKDGPEEVLANLARADRFIVEAMKIYRYEQRLQFMYFYTTFDEKFNDLNNVSSILKSNHNYYLINYNLALFYYRTLYQY